MEKKTPLQQKFDKAIEKRKIAKKSNGNKFWSDSWVDEMEDMEEKKY